MILLFWGRWNDAMEKKADTRSAIKVVTTNDFIMAHGLESISLNSRKLLYLAIAQCRKTDKEFFEYKITIKDFADLIGIKDTNLYQNAGKITRGLLSVTLECGDGKDYDQYTLFSKCSYRRGAGIIVFKLNPDMTDFLLNVKKDFTQPLLADFVRMKSPYSMAIWHLMQREMHSTKPGIVDELEFELTVDELRAVTGTQKKFKQIGQFKEKVLDKALREIDDNCGIVIGYKNLKKGRTITGFHFWAQTWNRLDPNDIPQSLINQIEEGKKRIAAAQAARA